MHYRRGSVPSLYSVNIVPEKYCRECSEEIVSHWCPLVWNIDASGEGPCCYETIPHWLLSGILSNYLFSLFVVKYTVYDNRMIKRQYYEICEEMIWKNVKLNQAKCHKKRQNSVQMCSKPNLRPQIFLVKRLHSFPQNLNAKNCMISFPFSLMFLMCSVHILLICLMSF